MLLFVLSLTIFRGVLCGSPSPKVSEIYSYHANPESLPANFTAQILHPHEVAHWGMIRETSVLRELIDHARSTARVLPVIQNRSPYKAGRSVRNRDISCPGEPRPMRFRVSHVRDEVLPREVGEMVWNTV